MMQSAIPKEVQARTGAAQTAQVLADYAEYGFANGEQIGGSTPLSANLKELKRITSNDPSLNQYLTPALRALMDYNGNTDAAKAIPADVASKYPELKASNDNLETALMTTKEDLTSGQSNVDLSKLYEMTHQDNTLLQYLDPNVRALLAGSGY